MELEENKTKSEWHSRFKRELESDLSFWLKLFISEHISSSSSSEIWGKNIWQDKKLEDDSFNSKVKSDYHSIEFSTRNRNGIRKNMKISKDILSQSNSYQLQAQYLLDLLSVIKIEDRKQLVTMKTKSNHKNSETTEN